MPKPSLSQHQGQFKGPYLSDFIISTVAELSNIPFPYKHKIVWVLEKECWYYRFDDAISGVDGWKAVSTPGRILAWEYSKTYTPGETVYYNSLDPDSPGKGIFVSLAGAKPNVNPLDDPEHWLCISDDTRVISISITNQMQFSFDAPVSRDIVAKFYENDGTDNYIEVVPETTYKISGTKIQYVFKFYNGYQQATYPNDAVTPIPYPFSGIVKILA